jgi:hypothetical protein
MREKEGDPQQCPWREMRTRVDAIVGKTLSDRDFAWKTPPKDFKRPRAAPSLMNTTPYMG